MPTGKIPFIALHIQDALGNPLDGTLEVEVTDADDRPITATIGTDTGGALAWVSTPVDVVAGAVADGLYIPDTRLTRPPNVSLRITVRNAQGIPMYVVKGVQTTTDSFNFDTYQPNVPGQGIYIAGLPGQGFNLRGAWTASTDYAPYDVYTEGGSLYIVETAYTSDTTFGSADTSNSSDPIAGGGGGGSTFDGTVPAGGLDFSDDVTLQEITDDTVYPNFLEVTVGDNGVAVDGLTRSGFKIGNWLFDGRQAACLDSTGTFYYAKLVSGYYQIFSRAKGAADVQLTTAATVNSAHPVLTSDGRILYLSDASGSTDLWIMGKTGAGQQLASAAPYATDFYLIYGQSLSMGFRSLPVVTTTQNFGNLSFAGGPRAGVFGSSVPGSSALLPLAPLLPVADNTNNFGETGANGFADRLSNEMLALGRLYSSVVGNVGENGTDIAGIGYGTSSYNTAIAMLTAVHTSLGGAGTVGLRYLLLDHGDNDDLEANTHYGTDVLALLAHLQTDVHAVTGQTTPIRTFFMPNSLWGYYSGRTTPTVPQQMMALIDSQAGMFFYAGHQQILSRASDGLHLTADSERWKGEYYAQAVARVERGETVTGVRMRNFSRVGTRVLVNFDVPKNCSPLQFNTTQVTEPHYVTGSKYGFECYDHTGTPVTINSASVQANGTSVLLTLAADPGTGGKLNYAWTCPTGEATAGDATHGARGNLCDTNAATSFYGYTNMLDWCAPFSVAL